MKPIHRTILVFLAATLLVAAIILVSAPPRGHAVVLLPAPTPAPLTIHVAGAVHNPGLYYLPRGSRLSDAITAAGGLADNADDSTVNLAAILSDGEKWTIPEQGDSPAAAVSPQQAEQDSGDESFQPLQPGQAINLNTASAVELELLPGIGPTLAQQIVTYRNEHGNFPNIEAIQDVPGIGPAKFESMRAFISVD